MRTHRNLSDSVSRFVDRRAQIRVPIKSVAYIDLGHENGGLILNISEGGIAMHVAEIVEGATFEKMRFQLPNSDEWIEAGGKLVWHGHSRKKAGVRFVNLSDEARQQIRNWTDSADAHSDASAGSFVPNPGTGREARESIARSEGSRDSVSEFDVAFPSENPDEPEVRAGQVPRTRVVAPLENSQPTTNQTQKPVNRGESGAASNHEPELRDTHKDKEVASPPPTADRDNVDASPKAAWSAPRNSMFDLNPQPDPFADVEYRLGGSDGWSRRNWSAILGIALAIVVVGGVLAIGPSNVKDIFVRKLPVAVKAPLQTNAGENAQAASTPPAENAQLPPPALAPAPAQSNASATAPAESSVESDKASDNDTKAADDKSSGRAARPVPLAKANPRIHSEASAESSDDAESAEEITRKFQLEHRDTQMQATDRPVGEMNPAPASPETVATLVPAKPSSPPSSDPTETRPSPAPSATSAAPTGLVAVSSHFESVQGVATDELEDDGRPTIGQLVSIKQPIYPVEAVRAHVEGTVRLRVVVDQIGRVEAVYVVSGPPLLVPAAIGAVREWRYNGTVLDSKAVKSVEDVAMVFRLANSVQSPRG
jgi:periplasmic protein TonB